MAVVLPNADLTVRVRTHPWVRDTHGHPVAPAEPAAVRGPWPGAASDRQDGTWSLRVDPQAWPVEEGDEVTDGNRTWVVSSRRLNTLPGYPDVDYIGITATLNPPQVP